MVRRGGLGACNAPRRRFCAAHCKQSRCGITSSRFTVCAHLCCSAFCFSSATLMLPWASTPTGTMVMPACEHRDQGSQVGGSASRCAAGLNLQGVCVPRLAALLQTSTLQMWAGSQEITTSTAAPCSAHHDGGGGVGAVR